MLKLIPEFSEIQINGIKSRAERRFYHACQQQLGDEWYVRHSIPFIARLSGAPKDGEADFVIFSPEKGFIVVEIKGGGIEFDPTTGKWTSTDSSGDIHDIKDPFLQGLSEKKAIEKLITNHTEWPLLNISRLICGHAVFLTDIEDLQPLVMSHAPREIMGCRADLQHLEQWINKVFHYWQGDQNNAQPLGKHGMKLVEKIFFEKRSVRPLLSQKIREEEERRIELTHQQALTLRIIENRNRAIISGGAGTGKTLLAVDRAIQLAKMGKETLLICYNRPLADYLNLVIGKNNKLHPMTFHQLCDWRIKQAFSKTGRDLRAEAEESFPGNTNRYDIIDPFALALSTESLPDERFDAIIVDEGQDFRGDDYWLPLELLLRNEKESYLYIFLDFNQAIYQRSTKLPINEAPFNLSINCRNTRYIHEAAYHYYMGEKVDPPDNEGAPVESHAKDTLSEQAIELHALVSSLISKEKMDPKDIVVLVAGHTKQKYYEELNSLSLPKGIKYSIEKHFVKDAVLVETVARFKGLESNILILWGLDDYDPTRDREDLYVAFSRAKSRLHLFGTQAACIRALGSQFDQP